MDLQSLVTTTRRPRFRRASEPPPFRLTDDDVHIVRQLARHRFLKSTHIAALVGRSLDRTNDRLLRLFHAGYIDRPRAQLDYYPTAGSSPIAYALADRGARLLLESINWRSSISWLRCNSPLVLDPTCNSSIPTTSSLAFPEQTRAARNPLSLRVKLSHQGAVHEIGLVPDLVFGLQFADGSRHSFMVEIDRGTMPIARSDFLQTSFERKMRAYLTAHVAKQHERQFGWKTFRVLTVTTDHHRMQSMMEALRKLRIPHSPGAPLFFFTTRDELRASNPFAHEWRDGNGRAVRLN